MPSGSYQEATLLREGALQGANGLGVGLDSICPNVESPQYCLSDIERCTAPTPATTLIEHSVNVGVRQVADGCDCPHSTILVLIQTQGVFSDLVEVVHGTQ